MENIDVLQRYWDMRIDMIRNDYMTRTAYAGLFHGRHDGIVAFSMRESCNGKQIYWELIAGKQLRVTVLPPEAPLDPNYNREFGASLTKNIPHDIQRLLKGKE
jgi:hypothetical protein